MKRLTIHIEKPLWKYKDQKKIVKMMDGRDVYYYKPKKAKCIITTLSFVVNNPEETKKIIEQVRKKHGIQKKKIKEIDDFGRVTEITSTGMESIHLVNIK